MTKKRLALELLIQSVTQEIVKSEFGVKFLKQSYVNQLNIVASALGHIYDDHRANQCLGEVIRDIAKGLPVVYKLAERFGGHLYATTLDIPLSVLPRTMKRKTFFVQFPQSISFKYEDRTFDNIIIDIGAGSELSDNAIGEMYAYRFYSVDRHTELDDRLIPSIIFGISPDGEGHVSDFIRNIQGSSIPPNIIEYCFKILLYIHSGEPDLVPERGNSYRPTNPEKYIRHIENHCPFQVFNIGYSFHERHRHVDGTMRVGHYRWQPCGPNRSQVKLIWIEEHPINFKR